MSERRENDQFQLLNGEWLPLCDDALRNGWSLLSLAICSALQAQKLKFHKLPRATTSTSGLKDDTMRAFEGKMHPWFHLMAFNLWWVFSTSSPRLGGAALAKEEMGVPPFSCVPYARSVRGERCFYHTARGLPPLGFLRHRCSRDWETFPVVYVLYTFLHFPFSLCNSSSSDHDTSYEYDIILVVESSNC
jgi:hypothetical protein